MTSYPSYRLHVDIEVNGRAKATAIRAIVQRMKEVTAALDIAMESGTYSTDYNHDGTGMFELREVRS